MIDVFLKTGKTITAATPNELPNDSSDFSVIQFIDYTDQEINWVEEMFGIDTSIMHHYQDIEISSHFLSAKNQVAFHVSIPYYNEEKKLIESPIFFIVSPIHLFIFSSSEVDNFFTRTYSHKLPKLQSSMG